MYLTGNCLDEAGVLISPTRRLGNLKRTQRTIELSRFIHKKCEQDFDFLSNKAADNLIEPLDVVRLLNQLKSIQHLDTDDRFAVIINIQFISSSMGKINHCSLLEGFAVIDHNNHTFISIFAGHFDFCSNW